MTPSLDRWSRGWRGPWLAALIALAAALPGALFLPVTDRSEARLAQAAAQMAEDRDFTLAGAGDSETGRRPLALHWLQAASVVLTTHVEDRRIWAYRLPALAGAMIAAAACAWGGAALFGSGTGLLAGAILGGSLLLSTAAAIDTPGALAAAGVALAMAALARLRLAAGGERAAGRATRLLLWLGVALAALAEGPAGPLPVLLAAAALCAVERQAGWLRGLGWGWGLILLAAVLGPSMVAGRIVAEHGEAWRLWTPAPAATGVRTPGFQALITPAALYPFALLLPAALMLARRARRDLAVRLALCWLVPSWIVLEFSRGQAWAGGLAFGGALAWLCALAARDGVGPWAARAGAGLQILAAAALIATLLAVAQRFGGGAALAWMAAGCGVLAAAALGGGGLMLRGRPWQAIAVAGALGLVGHAVVLAAAAPRLDALWLARRVEAALRAADLDPRDGVASGPIAVTGFSEPSLDFVLGGQTDPVDPADAAQALREGRPAIVAAAQEDAFLQVLGRKAAPAATVQGFDYVKGAPVSLSIYRPAPPR